MYGLLCKPVGFLFLARLPGLSQENTAALAAGGAACAPTEEAAEESTGWSHSSPQPGNQRGQEGSGTFDCLCHV